MAQEVQQKLLRMPSVRETVGLSRSEIYRLVKNGEFPKPVRLGGGRAVAWVASELAKWVNGRIAARDMARRGRV